MYPGTTILKNKLCIKNSEQLAEAEYRLTWTRRSQLQENPINGKFDLSHYQEIHKYLFQDLFDWAGRLREVNISKAGSDFHPAALLHSAADYTFNYIRTSGLLSSDGLSDDDFIVKMSEALALINEAHYFREGNGRAQRAFLDQVAACSGRRLAWRNVGEQENTRTSIEAFKERSGKPFVPLIRKISSPPLDGLDPFEDQVYEVSAGSINVDQKWTPR